MPRGEVALIVALVGLNSKIVTQSTYAIVVFMTAVTTVLARPCCATCSATRRSKPQRKCRGIRRSGMLILGLGGLVRERPSHMWTRQCTRFRELAGRIALGLQCQIPAT
jgi:Kef-type K+ transport system membrane component KefB